MNPRTGGVVNDEGSRFLRASTSQLYQEANIATEVWLRTRPKGRPPLWAFRVTRGDAVVFESVWVAIRYATREDAAWLADLVDGLAARGEALGRPGAPSAVGVPWEGDPNDDCWVGIGDRHAHAEHIDGPRHGGAWFCVFYIDKEQIFHTIDRGIHPRNGAAAR